VADAAFARVLAIAASTGLPGIEAGSSYGTPSLNVRGKFLARIKDADTLVVRCPVEEKQFLMEADPAVFFETDHYKGYPAFLVRLSAADDATIAGRLEWAWRMQAPKKLVVEWEKGQEGRSTTKDTKDTKKNTKKKS
jgi:hypothetical protein